MRGKALHPDGVKLSPKATIFAQALADTGDKLRAYKLAGYGALKKSAIAVHMSKLIHHPGIIKRVGELRKCGGVTKAQALEAYSREWQLAEHNRLMRVSEQASDITNATRNLEGIGRVQGYYQDRMIVEPASGPISEAQQREARVLAALMLSGAYPVIDTEASADEHECSARVARSDTSIPQLDATQAIATTDPLIDNQVLTDMSDSGKGGNPPSGARRDTIYPHRPADGFESDSENSDLGV